LLAHAVCIRKLINKGRSDARAWAVGVGLVPANVEAGKEVQAIPGEETAERELQEASLSGRTMDS